MEINMKLYGKIMCGFLTAAMLAGGVATSLYIWLLSGKKKSSDELAEEIGAMIRTNVTTV